MLSDNTMSNKTLSAYASKLSLATPQFRTPSLNSAKMWVLQPGLWLHQVSVKSLVAYRDKTLAQTNPYPNFGTEHQSQNHVPRPKTQTLNPKLMIKNSKDDSVKDQLQSYYPCCKLATVVLSKSTDHTPEVNIPEQQYWQTANSLTDISRWILQAGNDCNSILSKYF